MQSQTPLLDMHGGQGEWEAQFFDPVDRQHINNGARMWEAQHFNPMSTRHHHPSSAQHLYNGFGVLLQTMQTMLTAHSSKIHAIPNTNVQPSKRDCSDPKM
jgi:hypothetical protein